MTDSPYTLDKLRSTLIRLEDTIIFGNQKKKSLSLNVETIFFANSFVVWCIALIERAQFALNPCVYEKGALEFKGATGERSFLEYFFWETEKVHGKILHSLVKEHFTDLQFD